MQMRSPIWQQRATPHRVIQRAKPTGLCVENRALSIKEIHLLEVVLGCRLHIRTRLESWLVSLPGELQMGRIAAGNHFRADQLLVGSCKPFERLSES
jgi:hypothetical protein